MKDFDPLQQAKATAREAGLTYVTDSSPGFTRGKKLKSGFQYFDTHGKLLRNSAQLRRIQSLVIPPAWTSVWICPSEKGHLQATGRDQKGRKQYRYHPDWQKTRNEDKFSKMILFAQKLPRIRACVRRDLRGSDLGRRRVLAAIVEIMEQTMIRIGNSEYAEKNDSYGLTTLLNRHARIRGSKIRFNFKGKSGKWHDVEISDPLLAKVVSRCQELPGQELFAYKSEDGHVTDVTSQDVNDYLSEITGEHITAKDFRTWGGTVHAAVTLHRLGPVKTKKDFKKTVLRAIENTSSHLRNTVAVCRKYYIHPCVFESFENGHLFKVHADCKRNHVKKSKGLYQDEVFALRLLQQMKSASSSYC